MVMVSVMLWCHLVTKMA